ncbi:hypothetical protein D3C86_1929700 [compost metagenome]
MKINDDSFHWEFELICHRFNNAFVSLVRNDPVNLFRLNIIVFQSFSTAKSHGANGIFKDLATFHMNVLLIVFKHSSRLWIFSAATW